MNLLAYFFLDGSLDFFLIEVDQDGPLDIESWGCAGAVGPFLHLFSGAWGDVNIHLGVFDVIRLEPGSVPDGILGTSEYSTSPRPRGVIEHLPV